MNIHIYIYIYNVLTVNARASEVFVGVFLDSKLRCGSINVRYIGKGSYFSSIALGFLGFLCLVHDNFPSYLVYVDFANYGNFLLFSKA